MKDVYEIISRMDDAFEVCLKSDYRDYAAMGSVMVALQEALCDTKLLIEDADTILSVHEAVALVNHLNAVCKHYLLMKAPEQALEAFAVEYQIPEHIDQSDAESGTVFISLNEKLDDLFTVAWNAKQQEPFVDAALPAKLGFSTEAMALRHKLYTLKAEMLMRRNDPDAALFYLMESYSSLVDSISQNDLKLDQNRLKVLGGIRRCLDAKGNRRLSRWLQRKMDIIKVRNGEELDTPARYHPKGSLPAPREGWPCAAFGMKNANEAYEHLRGYRCIQHYGEDISSDGFRHLGRCSKCGGFILVYRGEYHGIVDYFPVNGPAEAESLIAKFDFETIERAFHTKYLTQTNGCIAWYDLHLRQDAD